jgi:hypothetical protein
VVTVVEPLESVTNMYTEKLNAFNQQTGQGSTAEG